MERNHRRGRLSRAALCAAAALAVAVGWPSVGHPTLARSADRSDPMAQVAEASHAGWPPITGMLLQNAGNLHRPLDGRPGHDPFDGTDPSYSCDGAQTGGIYHLCGFPGTGRGPRFTTLAQLKRECLEFHTFAEPLTAVTLPEGLPRSCGRKYEETDLVPAGIGHNELLGGNGNETIHAGPAGDVIWGDAHAGESPESSVDYLYGGPGNDWIYAAHGTNYIWTGAGEDHVMLVYGHGVVHCNGPGHKILVMRKLRSNRHYRLVGCTNKTIEPYAA